uniref:uncharacterized protein isoform X1 n=1 Tax=Myxine glutinosa TaxID=7769 RepID=UPI003590010E
MPKTKTSKKQEPLKLWRERQAAKLGNVPPLPAHVPPLPAHVPPLPAHVPPLPAHVPLLPGNLQPMPGKFAPVLGSRTMYAQVGCEKDSCDVQPESEQPTVLVCGMKVEELEAFPDILQIKIEDVNSIGLAEEQSDQPNDLFVKVEVKTEHDIDVHLDRPKPNDAEASLLKNYPHEVSSFAMPKEGSKGGCRGKAVKKAARGKKTLTPPPTPTPATPSGSEPGDPSHEGSGLEEEEVLSDTPKSPKKGIETCDDLPVLRKRRKKTARLNLSDEQEAVLVEWLQSHPELFDKGNKKYMDTVLKNKLWEEKAAELGVESGELLHVWYKSMRTRFGQLKKLKSGDGCKEFTSRDQWILGHFAFMSAHIYDCPNRGAGILKQKLQSRPCGPQPTPQPDSGSEDDDDHDDLNNLPTTPCSTPTPSTSATTFSATASVRGKGPGKNKSSKSATTPDTTDALVEQLSQSTAQAIQLQASVSALLSGQSDSMVKGYGTSPSTFVPSLHPSLLTQFYHESWSMVMRYRMQSERLKEEERQRQSIIPIAVRPVRPSSQLPVSHPAQVQSVFSQIQSQQPSASHLQPIYQPQQSPQVQQQCAQPGYRAWPKGAHVQFNIHSDPPPRQLSTARSGVSGAGPSGSQGASTSQSFYDTPMPSAGQTQAMPVEDTSMSSMNICGNLSGFLNELNTGQ